MGADESSIILRELLVNIGGSAILKGRAPFFIDRTTLEYRKTLLGIAICKAESRGKYYVPRYCTY